MNTIYIFKVSEKLWGKVNQIGKHVKCTYCNELYEAIDDAIKDNFETIFIYGSFEHSSKLINEVKMGGCSVVIESDVYSPADFKNKKLNKQKRKDNKNLHKPCPVYKLFDQKYNSLKGKSAFDEIKQKAWMRRSTPKQDQHHNDKVLSNFRIVPSCDSEKQQRIRASLDKINTLMTDLKFKKAKD